MLRRLSQLSTHSTDSWRCDVFPSAILHRRLLPNKLRLFCTVANRFVRRRCVCLSAHEAAELFRYRARAFFYAIAAHSRLPSLCAGTIYSCRPDAKACGGSLAFFECILWRNRQKPLLLHSLKSLGIVSMK